MLDSYLLNRLYCSWKWLQEWASTFHISELFTYILKPGSVDLWPMTPLAESLKQSWSGRFIKEIHLLCKNSHVIKQYLYTWGRSEWTWRPLILRSRIVIKINGKLDQAETDRPTKTFDHHRLWLHGSGNPPPTVRRTRKVLLLWGKKILKHLGHRPGKLTPLHLKSRGSFWWISGAT